MVRLKLRGGAEAFVATVDALSSELVANEKTRRRSRKTSLRKYTDAVREQLGKFGLVCSRRLDLARSGLQAADRFSELERFACEAQAQAEAASEAEERRSKCRRRPRRRPRRRGERPLRSRGISNRV